MSSEIAAVSVVDQQLAERRARRFWVSLIVFFLGLQVVIGGVSLYLATGDPSSAIVPNYHQAALDWDQTHQARTAAVRLGWTLDVNVSDIADTQGNRALQVTLADRDGKPIDDLSMSATIYHLARASQFETVSVSHVSQGRYQTLAPMQRRGRWQINLNIVHEDQKLVVQREIWVP